jgi:PAS domain S-box-containing protein
MAEVFNDLFGSGPFMPHGHCYLWMPGLVWLHVVADLLIALAYYVMPVLLLHFVRKRHDLPFNWMFLMFGAFIVACGTTHLVAVWTLWFPTYWFSAGVKVLTAGISLATALLLIPLLPRALALPSPTELAGVNRELRVHIRERQHAEAALRQARDELERRVAERTATLEELNAALQGEIGERRRVEAALRESEALYRQIFEENLTGDFIATPNGTVLAANPAFVRIFGLPTDGEGWGGTLASLFPTNEAYHTFLQRIRAEKKLENYEAELRRLDGTPVYVVGNALGTLDERSELIEIKGYVFDNSERKHAEEALRDSEQRYRSLFENNPLPMWVYDIETLVFLDVNDAGVDRYGYARDEFLAMTVQDIRPPEDAPVLAGDVPKPTPGLDTPELCRHLKKDGTIIDVEVTSHAIQFAGRQARLVLANDVTARLRVEAQIRRLNEGLERRVVERTAQLEATNHELETFSYSVSHDLRAPLRSIDGFSQALMEDYHDRLDAQGQDYLQRICGATQRMSELIDALLGLSRVTRAGVQREPLDLSAMAWTIAAELRRQDPVRVVEFAVTPQLSTEGDSRLLRIVMENLLGNAWKFTAQRDPAQIQFGARVLPDGTKAFFVHDNGAGFDMTYADKLFGAFQRLHSMSDFPGTGIGLATVQRIVRRHGGRVWAEGKVGEGATFYFTL